MTSNPYNVPESSAAPDFERLDPSAPTISFKSTLIAVICWQFTCLFIAYVYPHTVGVLVVVVYSSFCGDIQASYPTYSRLATYIGLLTVTLSASTVTLPVFNKLCRCDVTIQRTVLALVAWEIGVMLILIWSYESGFPSLLHEIGWQLWGAPAEIYSFQNLVLHRAVAWLFCTAPFGWLVLKLYARSFAAKHDTVP